MVGEKDAAVVEKMVAYLVHELVSSEVAQWAALLVDKTAFYLAVWKASCWGFLRAAKMALLKASSQVFD